MPPSLTLPLTLSFIQVLFFPNITILHFYLLFGRLGRRRWGGGAIRPATKY
jgi:hypothetical protein